MKRKKSRKEDARTAVSKMEVDDGMDDDDDEANEMEMDLDEQQQEEEGPGTDDDEYDDDKTGGNTFLDSFYGLSSPDPKERARSSQTMLQHCLLGPTSNTKDAFYAFRRLLNGICSGRACARQGNASALSSFLRLAFQLNRMTDIRDHDDSINSEEDGTSAMTQGNSSSMLKYVRRRLIEATDPNQISGKKKGSEERDYQFGRLFGILGVVRSGILLPNDNKKNDNDDDSDDEDDSVHNLLDIIDVSSAFVADLSELFWLKKWMREPAAHGISVLLSSLYGVCENNKSGRKTVQHIVGKVVVPKILLGQGEGSGDVSMVTGGDEVGESESMRVALLETFSAEQLAIAIHIQSYAQFHQHNDHNEGSNDLPFPLDKAILSTETLPILAQALGETSSVVQPRMHFVWDSIWSFLSTEEEDKYDKTESKVNPSVKRKQLRPRCPVGDESALDVLNGLIDQVVMEQLLQIGKSTVTSNITHERRSLALCLIRNLCGVDFTSSLSGRMNLLLEPDELESVVLNNRIVKALFIDVICAGNQGKTQKTAHLLKPLALQVLKSITASMVSDPNVATSVSGGNRRLACIRALSKGEIRFDARTKTPTIAALLMSGANEDAVVNKEQFRIWNDYVDHLQQQILRVSSSLSFDERPSSSTEATGYVELLYTVTKSIIRLEIPADGEAGDVLLELKDSVINRVHDFLMLCGFFNCRQLAVSDSADLKSNKKSKNKKKGKKPVANINSSETSENRLPVSDIATKLRDELGDSCIPYAVRSVIAARFFSLVSEHVNFVTHGLSSKTDNAKQGKDSRMLFVLSRLCKVWKHVESTGAKRWSIPSDSKHDISENVDPTKLIEKFQRRVDDMTRAVHSTPADGLAEAKRRCATGAAVLAHATFLHRLNCGTQVDLMENEDPDADDEEDEEEISNSIDELDTVLDGFFVEEEVDDGKSNPLLDLAGACVNILSSPLGSGNLGRASSPKLVREAVRFAWLGGLTLAAAKSSESETLLDTDVVDLLLESIGTTSNSAADQDEDDEDDDRSSDDQDSEDEGVFSKATGLVDNNGNMDVLEAKSQKQDEVDSDSDVELDPAELQSMLVEDSDADINEGELEHHEGADGALARLIKLKQESRKAGQQAREKMELSNQLRCTLLIELLMTRPESWNHLFRSDIILRLLIPMVNHRRETEKSLERLGDKEQTSSTGEKVAYVTRLTTLILSKLCKMRLASIPSSPGVDLIEYGTTLISQLMEAAKRGGTKEHVSCCSDGMIMVLRAISSAEGKIAAATAYGAAVTEWSSRKSRHFPTSLFDDFISHIPSLAQATLLVPLAKAAKEGHVPFLKLEALRLLSMVLAVKPDPQSRSDLEKAASAKIQSDCSEVVDAFVVALQDNELRPTKRMRIVLTSMGKLAACVESGNSSQELLDSLKKLVDLLDEVAKNSESEATKTSCTKLKNEVDGRRKNLSTEEDISMEDSKVVDEPDSSGSPSKSHKSRKKKKKKK